MLPSLPDQQRTYPSNISLLITNVLEQQSDYLSSNNEPRAKRAKKKLLSISISIKEN